MKSLLVLLGVTVLPVMEGAPCHPCHFSDIGASVMAHAEGFVDHVTPDPSGIPSIGHGHAMKKGEHFPEPMTHEEAYDLMMKDVSGFEVDVNRRIKRNLMPEQFDGLVLFAYNVRNWAAGSVVTLVNAFRDSLVPAKIREYVYSKNMLTGKSIKLGGLVTRRDAEASLYEMGTERAKALAILPKP